VKDSGMMSTNTDFFFHHPEFVFRKAEDTIIAISEETSHASISLYFTKKSSTLVSLDKSPFGGVVCPHAIDDEHLNKLLQNVDDYAFENKIEIIIIRCAPEIYQPETAEIQNRELLRNNFVRKYEDISQFIKVQGDIPIAFNRNRQRHLEKCLMREFNFRILSKAFLEQAFMLIVESRNDKGYPVTMEYRDLLNMFESFPDNYLLFGVFDGDKMIASSVSIVVNKNILYCFYFGDALSYRSYSPVTLLVKGIYNYAVQHKFEIIDLGISTDKAVLNRGLYDFKKSLGSVDSYKITYSKNFG
jgi:hypothetical protein